MNINYPRPPTPENIWWFVECASILATEGCDIRLDHSPESLVQVEEVIEILRHRRYPDLPFDLFCLGCYAGEMLVKHAGGKWRVPSELGTDAFGDLPLVVVLRDGLMANPIDKVFKNYRNGSIDSIKSFFDVMRDFSSAKPDEEDKIE